jgi:hypothetical protein
MQWLTRGRRRPQVMSSCFGQLKPKELASLQAVMAGQPLVQ